MRRRFSQAPDIRFGEVGGILGAAMALGAGIFLLHCAAIHAHKIHMLDFVLCRKLQAPDLNSTSGFEIPYQCFNLSALAQKHRL